MEADYRRLQDTVREPGFTVTGSVIERYSVCGCAGCRCRCQAAPPTNHGPYFQDTRKLTGKTLTRRLDATQVERCRGWISNRQVLEDLIDQMDRISWNSAELLRTSGPDDPE